jgi:hypothetical protein
LGNNMRFVRYILSNINLLNIILVVSAILIALAALYPYFYPQVRYSPPVAKLSATEEDKQPETAAVSPSLSDYMIIAEQNLFHPDRKIPLEKKEAQQIPKPELILYGTLITEGMSVAYVEDKKNPKTSPGRGKRQNVMKKGDTVGGFVLKEIEADRIMLSRGDETMVVHLSQGDKSRVSDIPGVAAASAKPVPGATLPPKPGTPASSRPAVLPTTPHSSATPTPGTPTKAPSPISRGTRPSPQK